MRILNVLSKRASAPVLQTTSIFSDNCHNCECRIRYLARSNFSFRARNFYKCVCNLKIITYEKVFRFSFWPWHIKALDKLKFCRAVNLSSQGVEETRICKCRSHYTFLIGNITPRENYLKYDLFGLFLISVVLPPRRVMKNRHCRESYAYLLK